MWVQSGILRALRDYLDSCATCNSGLIREWPGSGEGTGRRFNLSTLIWYDKAPEVAKDNEKAERRGTRKGEIRLV